MRRLEGWRIIHCKVFDFMQLISGMFFVIAAIFIEIAGFIIVGNWLGVLPTLALLLTCMLAGIILLRLQGRGLLRRIQKELASGRTPDREIIEGLMMVIGSVMLIMPGFVSDIIGILLFLPPLRALLWRYMAKYVTSSTKFYPRASKGHQKFDGGIIDLEGEEYQRQGDEKSPWRRLDDEK